MHFLNIDRETANQTIMDINTLPIQIMRMCRLISTIRVEKKKNRNKQTHKMKQTKQ